MKKNKIPLIVITGATGIGKSALAMELAQEINTELISADSRQIYKEFNIGTAKPTLEEQNLVKHHMIDIREPQENFTVAEYIEEVTPVIEDVYKRNKVPLMVGGTGLYVKSVIEGFSIPRVEPLPELRKELKEQAEKFGNAFLYQKAMDIDPESTSKIHENDIFRVVRILEIFEQTGKAMSSLKARSNEPIYDLIYVGLDLDREILYERIGLRVEKMFEEGLLKEVEQIIEKYGKDLPLLQTINYREVKSFLLGEITFEEAKELMKKDTRNFAKRQLTWFRQDKNLIWKEIRDYDDIKTIISYIKEKMIEKNMIF